MTAIARSALLAAALAAALVALAGAAEAHVFGAAGAGWAQGLAHPFSGLDHLLAMVAVGAWAAQMGGRAVWLLPLAFPVAMAAGAALALMGVAVPGIEAGVAASVVVLGVLVALAARPAPAVGAAVVALFALLHGHAHGSELPEAANAVAYALGFVTATLVLHGVGFALGGIPRALVRAAGAASAVAGLVLVAGAFL